MLDYFTNLASLTAPLEIVFHLICLYIANDIQYMYSRVALMVTIAAQCAIKCSDRYCMYNKLYSMRAN